MLFPFAASAHHSFAEFDTSDTVEIEGQVVAVNWQNPHVTLTLRSSDSTWGLEAQDVNSLGRRGLTASLLAVGDMIKVAGYPSRRREHTLFVTNVLLPTGTEIRTRGETMPRWSTTTIGFDEPNVADIQASAPRVKGIFRVWMPIEDAPLPADLPLTQAARTARSAWDPADNLVLKCIGSGMPAAVVITRYHPIAFAESDGDIVLRIEVFDAVRTIHMRSSAGSKQPPSAMGYSAGHWEEDTLVVHTTDVSWPYFDGAGSVPQSEAVEITERFTVNDPQNQLVYDREIRDPATFTAPVSQRAVLTWRPDLKVEPFECVPNR